MEVITRLFWIVFIQNLHLHFVSSYSSHTWEMTEPIVATKQGQLRGTTFIDACGNRHYAFLGVPYAKPPFGELRFRVPQPVSPWGGVRNATKEGSPCINRHFVKNTVEGEENCLFLNVYTPYLTSKVKRDPLPVMVWIHGGGFVTGSGSADVYGPDYLLTENVVFVSINYRLGLFGFLALAEKSLKVPGNAALKDIVLALKWIQENISVFGGDPNNVTLFGQSSGAACVHFMLFSPLAKGLFHRAILESGTSLNGRAYGDINSKKVAEAIGKPNATEEDLLQDLNNKTTEELFEIQEKLLSSNPGLFAPVIEENSPNAFIYEKPADQLNSGNYSKVPLLIGYTDREGMSAYVAQLLRNVKNITAEGLLNGVTSIFETEDDGTKTQIMNELKQYYLGSLEVNESHLDNIFQLLTDAQFLRSIYRTAKAHVLNSDQPTYYFRFSIDGKLNFLKTVVAHYNAPGCCHCDELGYLFNSEWTPEVSPKSSEHHIRKSVVRLWTNFAKYGDPNGEGADDLIQVEWKPVTKEALNFIDIGENLTVGTDPDQQRMDFWDALTVSYPIKSGF